ncbi:MAG: hypothetical protein E4H27_01610 [Anaerolineales bacterium]|nr:MAG: hypothetical protein E4H27_01610 [Anaerolineales bacterium]
MNTAGQTIPDVSQSVIARFLLKMIDVFGSCAVLALDDDLIIGVLWFYPHWIKQRIRGPICIQGDNYDSLVSFDIDTFPDEVSLEEKILDIECMMVVRSEKIDYTGKGIGKGMISHLVSWARKNSWTKVLALAISDIKPLMLWSGMYTVSRYQAFGFEVVEGSSTINPGLLEGANSQKSG